MVNPGRRRCGTLPSQRSGTNWPGQRSGPRLSLTSLAIGAILDIKTILAIRVVGVILAIVTIRANQAIKCLLG